MVGECPFCSLSPDKILEESELTITLRDGFPVSPGHTLIIPKRHLGSFFELTTSEREQIFEAIARAKDQLDKEFQPDGYNIGINDGQSAGQTVMHLHVHLIPRFKDDMDDPRGGIRWIFPDKADYWSDL
ncbi:MAG: HIT family protein [Gammaproteobacteria bacterium]|nr:MAG: HIT family protein [Gammaproteobacteria bacterium]